jgi:uncharacterized alkaline shock family protein YloU
MTELSVTSVNVNVANVFLKEEVKEEPEAKDIEKVEDEKKKSLRKK